MDLAPQMLLFAKVVEEGGFSAAARRQGLTPSAISKQIGQLEDRLGVRLLNRSTRSMSLTEEGHLFYAHCFDIATKVAEAESAVVSMGEAPQGTLKVVATVAFGKTRLLPLMPDFLGAFPEIRVVLELSDRPIDLVAEEVDVAIRFSEQIEDDSVVARKISSNQRVYCAAPEYLEKCGSPKTPEEISVHNCLTLTTVSRWNEWAFDMADGRKVIKVSGNFEANSADAVYHAALAGIGIARLSTYLIGDDLEAGRLVRVLPEYSSKDSSILAVFSNRRNLAPKIRVFIDYLTTAFGSRSVGE